MDGRDATDFGSPVCPHVMCTGQIDCLLMREKRPELVPVSVRKSDSNDLMSNGDKRSSKRKIRKKDF